MALDLDSFDPALKVHYTEDRVENMVYKDNPGMALMPKMKKFGGKNLPIPIIFGNPQGRSATFAKAKANKTSSKLRDFTLTRVKDYSLADIDNETLKASEGNSEAFMEAATTEIDGAIQSAELSMGSAFYRNGTGTIGTLAADADVSSADPLALANPDDIVNFEVGMSIQTSLEDGGTARNGKAFVKTIDRFEGTFTVAATDGGSAVALDTLITSPLAGDSVFVEGDLNAKLSGLDAWVPLEGPDDTSFFGVDRTVDATRLGGIHYDGRGVPIEEVLVELAARISREGGKPDYCFMSYSNWSNLEKALGSKVQYVNAQASASIGFTGIKIMGPKGPITVLADGRCQGDRTHMLTMGVWKIYSLGDAPGFIDTDGNKILRLSDSDGVEVRVGYYAQMGCRAPGWNGVARLS